MCKITIFCIDAFMQGQRAEYAAWPMETAYKTTFAKSR